MESGSQFLHSKDSKLHTSIPVEHEQARRKRAGDITSHKPANKLDAWLNVLERTHTGHGSSDARKNAQPQVLERIKQSYHNDLVIQPENIPESVYELEQRIARERGHGDVTITDEYREDKQREIVTNQTASLDRWVDYLSSDDASYPTWAKYWAFQSITKMGKLQKRVEVQPDGTEREVASFTKRDDTTVAPFAPLNPRALALTIGVMSDRLTQKGLPKDEREPLANVSTLLDNDEFQKLATSENFAKLYTQFLLELPAYSAEGLQETRGEWVVYPQGSDPVPLVQSLEGYPLEWCTANKDTAQTQLNGGDFYVYYSIDDEGKATIPRAAIRMEDNSIAEVRGIAHNQNLDPYIADVVGKKMHEFPDGESYTKKAADMAHLTRIEKLLKDNPQTHLSDQDLVFLYELNSNIEGFGYGRDPRIKQILSTRDSKHDLASVFGCSTEQISTTKAEALAGNIVYHIGNLDLRSLTSAEGLQLPQTVRDLYLSGLTSAEGLQLPQTVRDLYLRSLTSAEGLQLPPTVRDLDLSGLTSAEGLQLPQTVDFLDLRSLISSEGLQLPQTVRNLNLSGLKDFQKSTLQLSRPDIYIY